MDFQYIHLQDKSVSSDISTLFPGFTGQDERVCVMSPHDDDAIIGAGYAMLAAKAAGAELYLYIFCQGNAGYSHPSQKEQIVNIRKEETISAYARLGVKPENICRFNYSDFSVAQNIGWALNNGQTGSFQAVVTALRKHKITRVLVPNHYREHIDHWAVHMIGAYDAPQAGDPIVVDWGQPHAVRSVAEYSVWADFSAEDALANRRDLSLRANCMVCVSQQIEDTVCQGIAAYASQGQIIKDLIRARAERRSKNGRYGELYIVFDPRPKLNFAPYVGVMDELGL